MKNKLRIIFGYIFSFITMLTLIILILLLICRFTIYKKSYINDILDKNNYYTNVYNDIIEDMKDYMVSSGLPESILDNLFTERDVRKDVNLYIDNIYLGKKTTLDNSLIKERLSNNIETYLKNNNVEVTNDADLDSFIDEMTKIYNNQICLYKMLDSLVSTVSKYNNVLNKAIIIVGITFLILSLLIIIVLKVKYLGALLMSAGMILIFMRFLIYENIDVENIIIVSDNFSKVLKSIIIKLGNIILNYGVVLIIVGLIMSIVVYLFSKDKNMLEN